MKRTRLFGGAIVLFGSLLMLNVGQKAEASELTVSTKNVPQTVVEYAKGNWGKIVSAQMSTENSKASNVYLGTPFVVNGEHDRYVFPVVEKETKDILYTVEICNTESGDNSLSLNSKMAEELNEISNQSSKVSIEIEQAGHNTLYKSDNGWKKLISGDDKEIQVDELKSNNTDTKDVEITDQVDSFSERGAVPEFVNKMIPWTVHETQGSEPWCFYYVTSAILNNLSGKNLYGAEQLLRAVYPTATDEQLHDVEWIVKGDIRKTFEYLKGKHGEDIKYKNAKFDFSEVKKEIDRSAPLEADLEDATPNGNYGHSIALRGYIAPKNGDYTTYEPFYSFWNPWNKETFLVSSKSKTINLSQYTYRWYRTVYNYTVPK